MTNRMKNALCLNPTVTKWCSLITHRDAAKAAGFDAIEVIPKQLNDYLAAGYSKEELAASLSGTYVTGIGCIIDIEMQGNGFEEKIKEAHELSQMCNLIGCDGIQLLTGPINWLAVKEFREKGHTSYYSGLLGTDLDEQITLTAKNAARLADVAAQYGVTLYMEPLAWVPVNRISHGVEIIKRAERDNLKVIVDCFHGTIAGDTTEEISRMDKNMIYGVHICDTYANPPGEVPNEMELRNVPTGQGTVNLEEWVAAVKATGYDQWWSMESFCKKQQEMNPYAIAKILYEQLRGLVCN